MKKGKLARIVALAMLLVYLVGIQQGYAMQHDKLTPPSSVSALIESVSNPSGGCLNLGLNGWYGTVTVSLSQVWILLQHVNPSSTYTVFVAYIQTGAGCGRTLQLVGSVKTDTVGDGVLVQGFSLPSGQSYVFEFQNSAGTIAYATDPLTL